MSPFPAVRYLKAPTPLSGADTGALEATVRAILAEVRAGGDQALRDLSQRFDGVVPDTFEVSLADREAAVATVE